MHLRSGLGAMESVCSIGTEEISGTDGDGVSTMMYFFLGGAMRA